MSEQLCPLCGGSGAERTEERRITQAYAEVAAAAVRERDALRSRVAELKEALRPFVAKLVPLDGGGYRWSDERPIDRTAGWTDENIHRARVVLGMEVEP